MKTPPNVYRNANWPAPTRDITLLDPIRSFLRDTGAPHVIHMPQTILLGFANRSDPWEWLREKLGPAMIFSTDYSAEPYWTDGVWAGITVQSRPAHGCDFYFIDPDHAFEFKMRWR